jgi:hypothetical protein
MDGVREYRGGVLNFVSGVTVASAGLSPSSFRCVAVNGISESSSLGRTSGRHAMPIWMKGTSWTRNHAQPKYCRNDLGNLNHRSFVRKDTNCKLGSSEGPLPWYISHLRVNLEFGQQLDAPHQQQGDDVIYNAPYVFLGEI